MSAGGRDGAAPGIDLTRASAIVAGGASGLGAATVRMLAARGCSVVNLDCWAEATPSSEKTDERIRFVQGDIVNADDVTAAVDLATTCAPLRVAVVCAGIGGAERIVSRRGTPHDLDHFGRLIHVNLVGAFNVMRLAAAAMSATDPLPDGQRGLIIMTSSGAAFEGQVGQAAYAASKAGIAGLTIAAARDLAAFGIRVVTIAPGAFDTPLLQRAGETILSRLLESTPFPRRLGRPEEYAALVEHIVDNAFLNGETIRLDAGIRMPPA